LTGFRYFENSTQMPCYLFKKPNKFLIVAKNHDYDVYPSCCQ
jgi:hypothetical protein